MTLLSALFYDYKRNMSFRRVFTVFAVCLPVLMPSGADASFNGEVLIAPPPPNWSGGIVQQIESGSLQAWRRTFDDASNAIETITVRRSELPEKPDIADLADSVTARLSSECRKFSETKRTPVRSKIGTALSYSVTCKPKQTGEDTPKDIFTRVRVLQGEFNQYVIERTWRGDIKQPTSPLNSPRTKAAWQAFFKSTSVCNTLLADCSEDRARDVHAHERFKRMRALPVVARPVMPAKDIAKVARALGQLTGRAEACGEDITPLTGKIARMFAYISKNDQISSAAVKTFNLNREKTSVAQAKLKRDQCGEILRTFRSHPSRVGVFHKYVQRFL